MSPHLQSIPVPQNLEAERALLGAMLLDNRFIPDVAEAFPITPLAARDSAGFVAAFSSFANQEIFETIVREFRLGRGIDLTTLGAALDRTGRYEAVGGAPYLAYLEEEITSTLYLGEYVRITREHWHRRKALAAIQRALHNIPESQDPDAAISEAAAELAGIAEGETTRGPVSAADAAAEEIEKLEAATEGRAVDANAIPSGFPSLDAALAGGFHPGQLIVIAGGTSAGKSVLMGQFAVNAAVRERKRVAVMSCEMTRQEYIQRILSLLSGVSLMGMRRRKLSLQECAEMRHEAADALADAKLWIDDRGGNIVQIESRAKGVAMRHGRLNLLAVDYLQRLMDLERKGTSEESETRKKANGLKNLALQLGCCVITGSQVNEKESGGAPPKLHEMKYANAIAEEADVVIGVYRKDRTAEQGKIAILKQRNGPTVNYFDVTFNKQTASFIPV